MARVLNLIIHIKSLNAKVISLSIEVVPRSAVTYIFRNASIYYTQEKTFIHT